MPMKRNVEFSICIDATVAADDDDALTRLFIIQVLKKFLNDCRLWKKFDSPANIRCHFKKQTHWPRNRWPHT